VVGREAHTMQVGGEKWGGRLKFIWELWGKKKRKKKKKKRANTNEIVIKWIN
jgi:hypothetical protein